MSRGQPGAAARAAGTQPRIETARASAAQHTAVARSGASVSAPSTLRLRASARLAATDRCTEGRTPCLPEPAHIADESKTSMARPSRAVRGCQIFCRVAPLGSSEPKKCIRSADGESERRCSRTRALSHFAHLGPARATDVRWLCEGARARANRKHSPGVSPHRAGRMQARRAHDRVSIAAEPCPSTAIGRPASETETANCDTTRTRGTASLQRGSSGSGARDDVYFDLPKCTGIGPLLSLGWLAGRGT